MSRRRHVLFLTALTGLSWLSLQADAATLGREQLMDLFSEAKQYFRQAADLAAADPEQAKDLYRKAALRFERIAQEGNIQNGKLYYNIGNAYFRIGPPQIEPDEKRRLSLLGRNETTIFSHENLSINC